MSLGSEWGSKILDTFETMGPIIGIPGSPVDEAAGALVPPAEVISPVVTSRVSVEVSLSLVLGLTPSGRDLIPLPVAEGATVFPVLTEASVVVGKTTTGGIPPVEPTDASEESTSVGSGPTMLVLVTIIVTIVSSLVSVGVVGGSKISPKSLFVEDDEKEDVNGSCLSSSDAEVVAFALVDTCRLICLG